MHHHIDFASAITAWLRHEVGDDAMIVDHGDTSVIGNNHAVAPFAITVPMSQLDKLYLLANRKCWSWPAGNSAIRITKVQPADIAQYSGNKAHRHFFIHAREAK